MKLKLSSSMNPVGHGLAIGMNFYTLNDEEMVTCQPCCEFCNKE